MLHTALAVAAALVGLAVAFSTLDRWLIRRQRHELVWFVAFVLFVLAAAFMAAGSQSGWTEFEFRGFYLFGAIVNVPFLAAGSLMLSSPRRWGPVALWTAAAFGVFSAGVMVAAPFVHQLPAEGLAQGSAVFGPWPRALAGIGSGVGAMVVLLGSIVSMFRLRNGRRFTGNALIALGTLTMGASGMLNSVADAMDAFSLTLVLGIALIFTGYLTATSAGRGPTSDTAIS